jgi:hypothetical protein
MDSTSFKENVESLGDRVRPRIEEAKQRIGHVNGRVRSLVQDHPVACLVAALALGYLVARIARHQH